MTWDESYLSILCEWYSFWVGVYQVVEVSGASWDESYLSILGEWYSFWVGFNQVVEVSGASSDTIFASSPVPRSFALHFVDRVLCHFLLPSQDHLSSTWPLAGPSNRQKPSPFGAVCAFR